MNAGHSVQLPIISKIILGINIEEKNKEVILDLAKEKEIPVEYAVMKPDLYEMVIEPFML